MRGVNKVIIVGNLGRDPEVRYLPGGGAVGNITVATSEAWKDKETGQQQEQTEWHRVVFYGRLAEIAGEYLVKGSKVYIEGSLHTRKWQDKQTGQDRYATEIKASTLQMLDSRGQGGGQRPQQDEDFASGGSFPSYEDFEQAAPQQRQAPRQQQGRQQQGGQRQQRPPAPPLDNFDDDIPF